MRSQGVRSTYGQIFIRHKGHSIPTSVGSRAYDSFCGGQNGAVNIGLQTGSVRGGYAHRPDLIANLFLGAPSAWWIVCEQNSIFDVFEQLKPGDAIKIPDRL